MISNPITVDQTLIFTFDNGVEASQYDQWQHPNQGKKVDIVACDSNHQAWLIEAKDFRVITNPPRPANNRDLHLTVQTKVNDTLAGLQDTAQHASVVDERRLATRATAPSAKLRIVVHLEPHPDHGSHTKLFPKNFASSVLIKLKQLLKHLDPNLMVLSIATTRRAQVPWTVR